MGGHITVEGGGAPTIRETHDSGDLYLGSSGEISVGTGEAFAAALENTSTDKVIEVYTLTSSTSASGYAKAYMCENPTNMPTGLNGDGGGIVHTSGSATPDASIHSASTMSDIDGRNGIVFDVNDPLPDSTPQTLGPGDMLAVQGGEVGGLLTGETAILNVWFAVQGL